uniref:Uncharacterized protein n=1 Tax=viral metagenome TaxID=1070528 RepID=A0A6C0KH81_9ZZZZ
MLKRLAVFAGGLLSASAQLSILTGEINSAWGTLNSIMSAFKHGSKDTLLETLTNRGYKTFLDKTNVQVTQDIPEQYFPTFVKHMSMNLAVPPEKLQAFNDYVMDIQYVGSDQWSALQNTFSLSTGATCNYVMICTNHNFANKTFNWVSADIEGEFTLQPDIFVIAHETSSFFSDKTTIEFIEKPAGVKEKDFEAFFVFTKLIAFKQIGAFLGMDLEFPAS